MISLLPAHFNPASRGMDQALCQDHDTRKQRSLPKLKDRRSELHKLN